MKPYPSVFMTFLFNVQNYRVEDKSIGSHMESREKQFFAFSGVKSQFEITNREIGKDQSKEFCRRSQGEGIISTLIVTSPSARLCKTKNQRVEWSEASVIAKDSGMLRVESRA